MRGKIKLTTEDKVKLKLISDIYELENLLGFKRSKYHHSKAYRVVIKPVSAPEHNSVTVGHINNNIKFEVRSEESHHNVAHFHITIRGIGSGSYRIDNLEPITTSIDKKTEKSLLQWASIHRQDLVDTWNEFHGYRITVA